MYIARKKNQGKTIYILRESYRSGDKMLSRDLMDLGENPTQYIKYPGGNAYYIDPLIEETLDERGSRVDADTLDALFQPFLTPDIKHKIAYFHHRSSMKTMRRDVSEKEKALLRKVHFFDKRRAHFLKFGHMDQGPTAGMPPALFRHLIEKSRDELEQLFIYQEQALNPDEQKTYVYVAFNLQHFFESIIAKRMPQALDQNRVDTHFLEEICRINQSVFGPDIAQPATNLHPYLVRYLIMFFDNEYQGTTLLDDYTKEFIFRHRFYQPPASRVKRVSIDSAIKIFNITKDQLKTITKSGLRRRYRRLAQKSHPDKGGSTEKFIRLNDAFQRLLERLKSK